jgi:hypothetical protein
MDQYLHLDSLTILARVYMGLGRKPNVYIAITLP